jgi:hypothetical protein
MAVPDHTDRAIISLQLERKSVGQGTRVFRVACGKRNEGVDSRPAGGPVRPGDGATSGIAPTLARFHAEDYTRRYRTGGRMKTLVASISSSIIALQLAFVAAPHPFGAPHKAASKLFMPYVTLQQKNAEPPKTKVVCGTVVLEGSSKFDPKMTVEPPTDIQFVIRNYPRPACKSE